MFARSFVVPEKRGRYLSLLESERGRKKLLNGLNHCRDLDPRFAKVIPANAQSAQSIELVLRQKGAPENCYVMADNRSIDGREMSLSNALLEIVGWMPVRLCHAFRESWVISKWKDSMEGICLKGD